MNFASNKFELPWNIMNSWRVVPPHVHISSLPSWIPLCALSRNTFWHLNRSRCELPQIHHDAPGQTMNSKTMLEHPHHQYTPRTLRTLRWRKWSLEPWAQDPSGIARSHPDKHEKTLLHLAKTSTSRKHRGPFCVTALPKHCVATPDLRAMHEMMMSIYIKYCIQLYK